ncbi:transposase, MuDR, MULE transposase domain protein [Tanacetum coccineum]|uniref:Transposase, MuDR, MULE transposase domain protein n=1 Tax=Tanacetum coccineum TaxID=301880 RepID=A0ABQ4X128_9ASTR
MKEINNFQQEPDESLFSTWEIFKELLMKCPQHYLTDMQEVILFYNGLDVLTRQILDSKGAIPSKTVADAKVAIQEMAEYSQKWHNGTSSRTRSTKTSDGLAVIQAQLNNLGREIKKVNEKVYAAQLSRPQNCKKDKVSLPDGLAEYLQMKDLPNYRFPWRYRDIPVDREFCTQHIDLWVDLMWCFRQPDVDWAMVSPHFLPCTLGGNMIDCYSNGVRYPVVWRDVKKVYFPVNEPKRHWCLAELHITTGVVTFYDSLGWVYSNRRLWWRNMKRTLPQQLTLYLNEHRVLQGKGIAVKRYEITYKFPSVIDLPMMWTVMIDREVERDYGIARRFLEVAREVHTSLSTRQEIIKEAKHHNDPRMVRSVAFFREQQAQDMKLMDDIMLKISET